MADVTIESYDLAYLEALENEHPELGRIEVLHGTLTAGGPDMTGDRHQSVLLTLALALSPARPSGDVLRIDTYWFSPAGRLRPDVAVWRAGDRPADGGAFRVPPVAVIEILSADADHDLVRKREIYHDYGVQTWFVDPSERSGWWLRDAGGVDHAEAEVELTLPGWPVVVLGRVAIIEQ